MSAHVQSPAVGAGTADVRDEPLARALASPRIRGLDFMRAVAVLLVLADHSGLYRLGPLAVFDGGFGVEIFFVLSGFLITKLLCDEVDRNGSISFRAFYWRRAARLLPAFYLYLLGGAAMLVLMHRELPWGAIATASFYTINYYQAFTGAEPHYLSHCWSLAVEEQFYLVLPFVVLLMRPVALPWVLGGLICLAPMLRSHWLTGDHFLSSYVLMPFRADALLLGVLCAWAVRQPDIARLLERKRSLLFAAFWLLLAGSVALAAQYQFFFHPMMMLVGFTWLALLYATALLLAVSNQESPLKRVLRLPVLRKLGDIAFGVYLLHVPIAGLLHLWIYDAVPKIETPAQFGVTLAAFVLTIIVARASFVFFEKPIIRFGHRFKFSHKQDLPAMAASPQQVT
jgi:peptidoglycan/LPS O-acetylase OafA/YrhL